MGATSVKLLLKHLRERQETYGVNAFHFKNVYQNKKFVPAEYPAAAKEVIDAGPDALTWPKPDNRLSEKTPPNTSNTAANPPMSSQALPSGSPTLTSGMEISSPIGDIHISGVTLSDPLPMMNRTHTFTSGMDIPSPVGDMDISAITVPNPSPVMNGALAMNPLNPPPTPICPISTPVYPTNSIPLPFSPVSPSPIDSLRNIDPSLLVPPGDPFSHLRKTVMAPPSPNNADSLCSRANAISADCSTDLDLRFKPPKFSPFTTPKKSPFKRQTMDGGSPTPKASPLKRKRSDLEEMTTPTRSGRKIKAPKRFGQD
jgi:hypothetical protein